jgi:hypothetical protein
VQADPIPDIGRIQRQQAFVKKLARLAINKVTDDPLSAQDLADSVVPDLTVDRGFDRGALNQLARSMLDLQNGEGLTFATLPWEGGRADGQDVLFVDESAAQTVLDRLKGTAPIPGTTDGSGSTTPTTPAVRPSDVRVKVLNASGEQGAAGKAAAEFEQFGFVNGGAANDPRGRVDHSEVRYKPGDDAKAALVAGHVAGAALVADPTLSGTDVVVVLGENYTGLQAQAPASTGGAGATTTTAAPALTPEQACEAS